MLVVTSTDVKASILFTVSDYSQALEFDQLRKVMREGSAFVGFKEGVIDFPPTFKYDVLRTIRKHKGNSSPPKAWKLSTEKLDGLTEAELEEDDERAEVVSVVSTILTSIHSKPEDADEFYSRSNGDSTGKIVSPGKSAVSFVADKAKAKWTALFPPSSPNLLFPNRSKKPTLGAPTPTTLDVPPLTPTDSITQAMASPSRPQTPLSSTPRSGLVQNEGDGEEFDRGVYDSSSKKRVPSWYIAILRNF